MAPSPTGALHLGGVRTALFNWLFARHHGGEFLVRIENTDTSREVQGAVEHALESLAWLGLDWDRPPTFQLDRLDDYRRGAELLVYAHVPNVMGPHGKKLSKRHGATGVDELQAEGYYAPALMNFLALLGWAPDGETTIMSRDELIERFSLERVSPSPAQFDYDKLDWMNGVYLRALPVEELAHRLILWLGEQGYDWEAELVLQAAPLVHEQLAMLGGFPA